MGEIVLRPFEAEIIEIFRVHGTRASPKGWWIRDHLMDVGKDYVYSMWKRYVRFCEAAKRVATVTIHPGPYRSFRTYVYLLRRLGLLTLVEEVKGPGIYSRRYYAITPGREEPFEDWLRPYQTIYPSADWKLMTREEKRIRRRKAKLAKLIK